MSDLKRCSRCKSEKPRSDFYKHSKTKDGLQTSCRDCSRKHSAEWSRRNPDSGKARWKKTDPETKYFYHVKHKYGLTRDQYMEMRDSQGGVCKICKAEVDGWLHVDHCHETGRIRGLLCATCNWGLGYFKDSQERLARAIEYLSVVETD